MGHHAISRLLRSLSQRRVNGRGSDRGILDAEIGEAQRVQASQTQTRAVATRPTVPLRALEALRSPSPGLWQHWARVTAPLMGTVNVSSKNPVAHRRGVSGGSDIGGRELMGRLTEYPIHICLGQRAKVRNFRTGTRPWDFSRVFAQSERLEASMHNSIATQTGVMSDWGRCVK